MAGGQVVDFSLQTSSSVNLKDVAVLGECCPASRDSSLNVLVFVSVSWFISLLNGSVSE